MKKIAVGQSHSYLLNILREVSMMTTCYSGWHLSDYVYQGSPPGTTAPSEYHPVPPFMVGNESVLIVRSEGPHVAVRMLYRRTDWSSYVPPSVLMQWAEGGSLDDFIDVRLGRASSASFAHLHPGSRPASGAATPQSSQGNPLSRSARIRAFRAMQHASPEERERLRREAVGEMPANVRQDNDWKAVHLLSAEEVKSIFKDVVEGLAFLVSIHWSQSGGFELMRQVLRSTTNLSFIWT